MKTLERDHPFPHSNNFAHSITRIMPLALFTVSSYSFAGMESATTLSQEVADDAAAKGSGSKHKPTGDGISGGDDGVVYRIERNVQAGGEPAVAGFLKNGRPFGLIG